MYEKQECRNETPLFYAGAFQLSEYEAKKLAIKTFKELHHRLDTFIDTCNLEQREHVSKCLNCECTLYLRGTNGCWECFADDLYCFMFQCNILNTNINYKIPFWVGSRNAKHYYSNANIYNPESFLFCKKIQCML
jgi:hypothetical protein